MTAPKAYSFKTVWHIAAPLSLVWDTITHPLNWPSWWKGVESVVEITAGNENGIDGITRYTWKSALPYRLTFDMQLKQRVEYSYLKGIAFGELKGTGEWYFEMLPDKTTKVVCLWEVTTEKLWMNFFSFILRPVFSYNHTLVMKWGEQSLKRKLGI